MANSSVLKLRCAIQSYKWGKLGSDSEVAKLSYNACNNVDIEDSSNYAELWMGTHSRGPSVIEGTNETLQEWITSNPECLGEEVRKHFGNKLPFLFKILSINKALSIQIHPNKEQAEVLFREDPERYPDPNHKPEIAIALTKFEAFCGFRPIKEIISFLDEILELQVLVGDDNYKELKATQTSHALKNCFYTLMKCDEFKVKKTIDELSTVFAAKGKAGCKFENDLFLKIHSQHPGDIGCFGVYFFNYIVMEPGQALYLPANVPHAYIGGDCIECMACSDNVLRCGLTPKFIDVDKLCELLTFSCGPGSEHLFTGIQHEKNPAITIFNPPIPDFAVNLIKFTGAGTKTLDGLDSASIIILIDGEFSLNRGKDTLLLKKGSVIFIPSNNPITVIQNTENVLMFQAYTKL